MSAPSPSDAHASWGPFVYFPEEEWHLVTRELLRLHPPGTASWGTNSSKWKEGFWYVWGHVDIPMEDIVRSTLHDESTIEVLSRQQGLELEQEQQEEE